MDFQLTEEQKMIRDMSRRFANEVIAPRVEEIEKTGEYPYDIIAQMGELGMMGIPFPEEYGGSGSDWVSMMLCTEEISRADSALGALLDAHTITCEELYQFGTEEQKKKWLVPLVQGKELGAFGLTEPNAGSDARAIKTTAVLDGEEWVINGTKQFISLVGYDNCSLVIVAAVSGTDKNGKKIINTFIVPKGTPGFTIGQTYDKMGWHHFPSCELLFENCRVPKENLLGEPGKGFAQHLSVLQTGRIFVGAISVGMAQACFEASLRYAKERVQFGKPIYSFQAVSFKIADMAMNIELARNMVLKAAWLKDNNMPYTLEAAYAKLFASEALEKIASDAVQIHGGYGFMNEYPVSRYYRECKVLQIIEGTSEVQRMIISRILGQYC
ncbi:MAG TPA: acyl-CoA dehydrogenase [Deltaproteobacteria bacterium]|nr:MAG: acyl-CoA dehydrogenase [Deltaproteobacteria bacterium]HDM78527.1 acyl-CoA dehydrogenase [Deltaproteobacteria bacterium]